MRDLPVAFEAGPLPPVLVVPEDDGEVVQFFAGGNGAERRHLAMLARERESGMKVTVEGKGCKRYLAQRGAGADLAARLEGAALADPAALYHGGWLDDHILVEYDSRGRCTGIAGRVRFGNAAEAHECLFGYDTAFANSHRPVDGADAGSRVDDGVGRNGDQVGTSQNRGVSYHTLWRERGRGFRQL